MKKFILGLTLAFTLMLGTTILEAQTIPIYFNSTPITLKQNPVIQNGATLVPLRGVFETLGFDVKWDASTNTISMNKDDLNMSLQIGNTNAIVNGENKKLAIAPKIVNGNTMVPLRFISEAAGYDVNWNSDAKYITVGEIDKDLIDMYERVSFIFLSDGNKFLRVEDLYTVDGTGTYSGYKKILGHPYGGVDIYYRDTGNGITAEVVDNNYKPNEVVNWTYDGTTIKSYRKDVYDYINEVYYLAGSSNGTTRELKEAFGQIYSDWLNHAIAIDDGYNIAQRYDEYLNGKTFEDSYAMYQKIKDNEAFNEYMKKEAEEQEAKKLAEEKAETDYHKKIEQFNAQYLNEWVSIQQLKHEYYIYTTWSGNEINIFNARTNEIFTIKGMSEQDIQEGKVYEDNGIKYQYVDEMTYPFPEAKDGTGVYKINVQDLIFSKNDLKRAGIID